MQRELGSHDREFGGAVGRLLAGFRLLLPRIGNRILMKLRLSCLVALLASLSFSQGQVLFSSGFDTDLGFGSELNSADNEVTFGYDYSADGIAAAPNGVGTVGLKLRSNISGGAATGVAVHATNASFTGQYRASFDIYTSNVANGSTEFIGGGVGFSVGAGYLDGAVMIGSTDGDTARAVRFYADGVEDTGLALNNTDALPSSVIPGAGGNAAGTLSFAWHTMDIVADTDAMTARFLLNGSEFGMVSGVDVSGGVSLVYADLFSSIATPTDGAFGLVDNLTVTQIPEPSSVALLMLGIGLFVRRRR